MMILRANHELSIFLQSSRAGDYGFMSRDVEIT